MYPVSAEITLLYGAKLALIFVRVPMAQPSIFVTCSKLTLVAGKLLSYRQWERNSCFHEELSFFSDRRFLSTAVRDKCDRSYLLWAT